ARWEEGGGGGGLRLRRHVLPVQLRVRSRVRPTQPRHGAGGRPRGGGHRGRPDRVRPAERGPGLQVPIRGQAARHQEARDRTVTRQCSRAACAVASNLPSADVNLTTENEDRSAPVTSQDEPSPAESIWIGNMWMLRPVAVDDSATSILPW